MNARSLIWSVWDVVFLCTGFCVGLPWIFERMIHAPSRLVQIAAPNAYGAYIVQLVPLLSLQLALARAPLAPLAKFAIVSMFAVPLSFMLGGALRMIPGLKSAL